MFASTVINYIDRQTLSVLAPHLKSGFHWSNSDFALLIIAFRIACAIGQTIMGRFLDVVGTRRGLLYSVPWLLAGGSSRVSYDESALLDFPGFLTRIRQSSNGAEERNAFGCVPWLEIWQCRL